MVRRATSLQNLDFMAVEPYFAHAVSGVFPQRSAMSVQVTKSIPPDFTACTAASKNRVGAPYGSRSMTSNWSSGLRELNMSAAASAFDAITRLGSKLLNSMLRAILWYAFGRMSLARIVFISGISCAYRMDLKPVADRASRTRMPGKLPSAFSPMSASHLANRFSKAAISSAASDPAGASPPLRRSESSLSRWARRRCSLPFIFTLLLRRSSLRTSM
mmetsp:Transcript_40465/g.59461  ORF Transcript_40465/g.59461 Transcript_40465/m.59461 type:complete len:217 (-) Transcript_40465:34-684(-)